MSVQMSPYKKVRLKIFTSLFSRLRYNCQYVLGIRELLRIPRTGLSGLFKRTAIAARSRNEIFKGRLLGELRWENRA